MLKPEPKEFSIDYWLIMLPSLIYYTTVGYYWFSLPNEQHSKNNRRRRPTRLIYRRQGFLVCEFEFGEDFRLANGLFSSLLEGASDVQTKRGRTSILDNPPVQRALLLAKNKI